MHTNLSSVQFPFDSPWCMQALWSSKSMRDSLPEGRPMAGAITMTCKRRGACTWKCCASVHAPPELHAGRPPSYMELARVKKVIRETSCAERNWRDVDVCVPAPQWQKRALHQAAQAASARRLECRHKSVHVLRATPQHLRACSCPPSRPRCRSRLLQLW